MKVVISVFLILLMVLACTTIVSAVPTNGGFETGDATGWNPSIEQNNFFWGMFVQGDVVHSGDYAYLIRHDYQANVQGRSIWQNLDLSAGDHLSFWLNVDLNPIGNFGAGSFAGVDIRQADFGSVITNLVTIGGTDSGAHYGTDGWQHYEFDLGDYTALDQVSVVFWLSTYNNSTGAPNRIYIDDVSVVPLPASIALGVLGIGCLLRRRKMFI